MPENAATKIYKVYGRKQLKHTTKFNIDYESASDTFQNLKGLWGLCMWERIKVLLEQ